MKKGKIHSFDKRRTYIKVHSKALKKDKHSHLFPGRKSTKIVPALRKRHHKHLKKGEHVYFEIRPRNAKYIKFMYHAMPILGIIVGFGIGISITKDEVGIIALTALFMLLAINLQSIIRKNVNIFREIDVHIHEPVAKVEIFKAKKK